MFPYLLIFWLVGSVCLWLTRMTFLGGRWNRREALGFLTLINSQICRICIPHCQPLEGRGEGFKLQGCVLEFL